jgi:hypothetical protein
VHNGLQGQPRARLLTLEVIGRASYSRTRQRLLLLPINIPNLVEFQGSWGSRESWGVRRQVEVCPWLVFLRTVDAPFLDLLIRDERRIPGPFDSCWKFCSILWECDTLILLLARLK